MSHVLFSFRTCPRNKDLNNLTNDLLDKLKATLADLGGEVYLARSLSPNLETGLVVTAPQATLAKALIRTREHLRGLNLSFDEGELESAMIALGPKSRQEEASRCIEAGKAFSHLGMLDEALEELKRGIEQDGTVTEAYHYLVAILRQQGKASEALQFLERFASFQESDASFQFLFARLLNELGCKEQAISKLKAAIRLKPKMPEPYVQLGKILQEMGDFDASELSFQQALCHAPLSPEAHLGLGSIALSRGDFDGAEDHLLDALDLQENLHEARLLLGWTYFKDCRYDQAENQFLQVAYGSDKEFHLSALFSLAQLYLERQNPLMTIEVVERAKEDLLKVPEACRVLADAYYLLHRNEEALDTWDRGLDLGLIATPELCLRRAVALSRLGKREEAEAILSKLETREGVVTAALELRASLRMAAEDWQEAYTILHQARDTDPNSAMIAFQLGWVAENLGLIDDSEHEYKRSLRLDPKLHEAYSGLGWLYYRRERYTEALVLFEEALALQPNNPETLEQVAWMHLLLKDDLAALDTLDLAVRLDPEAPLLRAYRACALLRLGEHAEARQEVDAALRSADDEMVEALGHYLNGLLFLEEGDDYQAGISMEKSLDSQELPPDVVQVALQGPLKEKGTKAWSEARQRRQRTAEEWQDTGTSL